MKATDQIPFGRYKGKTLEEIAEIDPEYILWLHENVKTVKIPRSLWEGIEWDIRYEMENIRDCFEDIY